MRFCGVLQSEHSTEAMAASWHALEFTCKISWRSSGSGFFRSASPTSLLRPSLAAGAHILAGLFSGRRGRSTPPRRFAAESAGAGVSSGRITELSACLWCLTRLMPYGVTWWPPYSVEVGDISGSIGNVVLNRWRCSAGRCVRSPVVASLSSTLSPPSPDLLRVQNNASDCPVRHPRPRFILRSSPAPSLPSSSYPNQIIALKLVRENKNYCIEIAGGTV